MSIVTMLPAGKHVISVWTEIAPKAKKGALLIDSSTIDVDSARRAHALAEKAGLRASTRRCPAARAAPRPQP